MAKKKKSTVDKMHDASPNLSAVEREPAVLEFRCPECGSNALSWGMKTYFRAIIFEDGYVDFHEEAEAEPDENQTEFGCCNCGLLICDGDEPIRTGKQLVEWIKAHSSEGKGKCNLASASEPASPTDEAVSGDGGREESLLEIVERFKQQDFMTERIANLSRHLEAVESQSREASPRLIEIEALLRILDDAREKGIPDMLLESLWDLWNSHPDHVSEPPIVRPHALSDVISPFWGQSLEHELKIDLLYELEGEENVEKLYGPQPQSEIDSPQNLYQLVRKAWDQDRMEELLGMIEEDHDFVLGETLDEAVARHRGQVDESLRGFSETSVMNKAKTV
jgi:predicted RNA-binding Zn-ribbon protein involved in translation (DUF1610 family)